jgi:CO/xanthine dehydrogenase FAD-binding subunit
MAPKKLKFCLERLFVIPFEMVEPASLQEALSLLDPDDPTIRPVAGGTALMLMMKAGVFQPSRLICLHKIAHRRHGSRRIAHRRHGDADPARA